MPGSGTEMGFGGLSPTGGGEPPPGKIGMIGTMGTDPPGETGGMIGTMGTDPPGVGGGESYGGRKGAAGSTGSSNTAGAGSSGDDGATGGSEMRLPQRILDAFSPSVISVSPLKRVILFLVQ